MYKCFSKCAICIPYFPFKNGAHLPTENKLKKITGQPYSFVICRLNGRNLTNESYDILKFETSSPLVTLRNLCNRSNKLKVQLSAVQLENFDI